MNIEAFRHLKMSQQRYGKLKVCWTSLHNERLNVSCVLYAHSQFLCSLATFDFKPGYATASTSAYFLCSTARIPQDISAASFCISKLL